MSTYPDSVKLLFFQWVVEIGLEVKDKELARGWDKDGQVHPLKPATIKNRKSEVGPVTKNAPRLTPALDLSRVRSLLTGRAHATSAEFYWKFDSHTGDSFAVILHYAALAGHDVFGLSDAGTAYVTRQALAKWQAWKIEAGHARPTVNVPWAVPIRKAEILRPIRKMEVKGHLDLTEFDLAGNEARIQRAIEAGQFSGFRRLNARGEQWKPGGGESIGPATPPRAPVKPGPAPGPRPTLKSIVEADLGVKFTPPPAIKGNPEYVTVVLDIAKVDADLRLSKGQYVGPGGTGAAIGGRYEEFQRFLAVVRTKGIAIEQPRMYLAADTGRIDIGDGRHRFAVLRDQGARWIPASVPRDEAAEIKRRYGAIPDVHG